jgi:CheY-like chemotaxis protein
MDIKLKDLTDGIEAAAVIKKMYQVPVIFLTASSKEEDLERAKMVPRTVLLLTL